jgi:hypothetical protein
MKQLRALCLALILALVVGLLPIAAPARAEGELPYWIGVDVVNQRVTVYSTADNSVVHRWLCSTGKSATPTPTGTYTIPASHNTRKEWYKFGGVYVKWATRVTGGIYFHSVLFSKRSDNALIRHSGLLCIDFDHLPDPGDLFRRLLLDDYFDTQLLFRSPSGDGLKWIIPVDLSEYTHGEFFEAVAEHILQSYGVQIDKSGSDVSRACFLPYDPHAYINPEYLHGHGKEKV